jgi:hypothetical protein
VSLLYITFSDQILTALLGEHTLRLHAWLQTAKGSAFIVVTAVILYFWNPPDVYGVRESARARRDTERRTQLLVERRAPTTRSSRSIPTAR